MTSGYYTGRTETCRQVLDMLQSSGLVMMRAPPRSGIGNTSLCQLVALMAKNSSVFQQVYCCSCAAVGNDESFQNHFLEMCGVTFDEAAQQASTGNRTVIVIDEAQTTYETVPSLWKQAKRVLSSLAPHTPSTPQRLTILTASSHGSNPLASMGHIAPPIEFDAASSILFR